MTRPDHVPAPVGVVAPLMSWASDALRDLPWRQTRDPWSVLVSEVMLQQTQVNRVIGRYHQFLDRFPTVVSCAQGSAAEVIELWAGLGYNRRAVNLWRTAVEVDEDHGGRLPNDLTALLALPGIGPYTARAVLAFAFEEPVGVVDTNVGRLLARWSGRALTSKQAQVLADELVWATDPWTWNQALFDFATAICTKRMPDCGHCPLREVCAWGGEGPDPATSTAGVSSPQARFEGSQRQVRGRLVAALRSGPVPRRDLARFGRDSDSHADVARIAATLVVDGLAIDDGTWLRLPGTAGDVWP